MVFNGSDENENQWKSRVKDVAYEIASDLRKQDRK